jgi:tetraacyldisaccharide 4'-kinase
LNYNFNHIAFKDHHNFSDKEIKELSNKELILTTEKDYMRLKRSLKNVYYLSIVTEFINDKSKFDESIQSFVKSIIN